MLYGLADIGMGIFKFIMVYTGEKISSLDKQIERK